MKEKVAEFLLTIQGFRKFLMCLFVILIATIFRVKSLVSGGEWSDLSKAVAIAFCGTNGLEGITAVVKEHLALRRAAGNVLSPPQATQDDVELIPSNGDSK